MAGSSRRVTSVCTGALVLAAAGLLDDRQSDVALALVSAARLDVPAPACRRQRDLRSRWPGVDIGGHHRGHRSRARAGRRRPRPAPRGGGRPRARGLPSTRRRAAQFSVPLAAQVSEREPPASCSTGSCSIRTGTYRSQRWRGACMCLIVTSAACSAQNWCHAGRTCRGGAGGSSETAARDDHRPSRTGCASRWLWHSRDDAASVPASARDHTHQLPTPFLGKFGYRLMS